MSAEALQEYTKQMEIGAQILKDNKLDLDVNDHLKNTIALLVNQQAKINQDTKLPDFIKQLSIPTLVRSLLAVPNICSIQSSLNGKYYHLFKAGQPHSLTSHPSFCKIAPSIVLKDIGDDIKYTAKDLEGDSLDLSINIADMMARAMIMEMMDKAETIVSVKTPSVEGIIESIEAANIEIKDKCNKSATFIVMPLGFAEIMQDEIVPDHTFHLPPCNIRRIGYLRNKWIVYICAYPMNEIVIGYQGIHPLDSGYIYSLNSLFHSFSKKEGKLFISQSCYPSVVSPKYYGRIELTSPEIMDSINEL